MLPLAGLGLAAHEHVLLHARCARVIAHRRTAEQEVHLVCLRFVAPSGAESVRIVADALVLPFGGIARRLDDTLHQPAVAVECFFRLQMPA